MKENKDTIQRLDHLYSPRVLLVVLSLSQGAVKRVKIRMIPSREISGAPEDHKKFGT